MEPPSLSFFRRFLIGMLLLYLLFGSSVLSVWLFLRPRVPVFELDIASVSNLTIHNSTSTSSSNTLSGTWELGFHVRNHNSKIRISYDNITSSVYYRRLLLTWTSNPLPPFDQATPSQASINASFSFSAPISRNRKRVRRTANFDARITATVTFRVGGWRPRRRSLTVDCKDVLIDIPVNATSGKMVDGPLICRVQF